MDTEIFVENIKKYCSLRNVKPTVACRESGVGRSFMTNLESKGSLPSVEKVQLLAQYLGVTTSDLLGEIKDSLTIVTDEEAALNEELISRLCQLSPEELEKVDAFVQGLLAAR